jgi:SAM-dependent methyltransferase
MTAVVDRERALYNDAFKAIPNYERYSPGELHARLFQDMTGAARGRVLDAGCGTGKGALALAQAGFDVTLLDFVDDGRIPEARSLPFIRIRTLWDDLQPALGNDADYVYCADVMEHIPEALTMLVASRLLDVAREGVFFSIALEADNLGIWIGEHLHKTVKPFTWWRDMLREVGDVVGARDMLQISAFYVRPRRNDLLDARHCDSILGRQ